MKNIKIILIVTLGLFFYSQTTIAQSEEGQATEKAILKKGNYKKVAKAEVPKKVHKSLANIAGYKVKDIAISTQKNRKSGEQLYLVTMVKGKRTMRLIVNQEGKEVYMFE